MKKKEKGQIESVDLVISLALLMIMLGYTYRVAEANYYAYKQDEIYSETRVFGASAAELLISSPETTCTVVNTEDDEIFHLMNCLQINKLTGSAEDLRSNLGLVEDKFRVRVEIGTNSYGDGLDDSAQNVYSENRLVITSNGDMDKSELEKCMKDDEGCTYNPEIATIYVWRV